MSRRAHDSKLVARALVLGYGAIARELFTEFGQSVGESTVRDWVTYRTRPVRRPAA